MNDANVRYAIMDEMEEAGIARREGVTLVRTVGDREYLVALALFDVSDYEKEMDYKDARSKEQE